MVWVTNMKAHWIESALIFKSIITFGRMNIDPGF